MKNIIAYLNKPSQLSSKPWLNIIIAAMLVCFILGIFQPFGLYRFSSPEIYFIIALYTLSTAISTFIVAYILPFLFKKFYLPQTWTIGKTLINRTILVTLIVLGNYIVSWILGFTHTSTLGSVTLSYILVTIMVGIIPAMVIAFIQQNYKLKQNLYDANELNKRLPDKLTNDGQLNYTDNDAITLTGNTKETISLVPSEILFIEVIGNYVSINYISDSKLKQKELRATISQIEGDLQAYTYLVRCHRAFIVNISYISNIEGNSHGFQLQLHKLKDKIPVSRTYTKTIRSAVNLYLE